MSDSTKTGSAEATITPADFTRWLRDVLAFVDGELTKEQVEKIRAELARVDVHRFGATETTKANPTTPGPIDWQKILDLIRTPASPVYVPYYVPYETKPWPELPRPWYEPYIGDPFPTTPTTPWIGVGGTWCSDKIDPNWICTQSPTLGECFTMTVGAFLDGTKTGTLS